MRGSSEGKTSLKGGNSTFVSSALSGTAYVAASAAAPPA